ncbi:MAG: carboxynorspermidine decarboxylase [Methyloprofundus sp.]|nr:carboxynorspermidine decarboxylase [Methyloprofundus sp.]
MIPTTSPAFIIRQHALQHSLNTLSELRDKSGCHVLYSIKALPFLPVLEYLKPAIDGFSVSSLFEAKIAAEVLSDAQSIHLTTPGIRPDEIAALNQLCTHISFNSLHQQQSFQKLPKTDFSAGLRINPKLPFADDKRFNPCRLHSKLGLSIDEIKQDSLLGISGLHIHTVFSQTDYAPLLQTIEKLQQRLGQYFNELSWINLGGGYLFNQIDDHQNFIDLVLRLRQQYGLQVYIEPGKAVVGEALDLVTTVLDCFVSDGKVIAVLDTSINHNPEVFEYQRQPAILQHKPQGKHSAILVGSSCLAGDVFGEYQFSESISIGDNIHFTQLGAYTLVKANRFNGYNFPDIYWADNDHLQRVKHYDYQNYQEHWTAS